MAFLSRHCCSLSQQQCAAAEAAANHKALLQPLVHLEGAEDGRGVAEGEGVIGIADEEDVAVGTRHRAADHLVVRAYCDVRGNHAPLVAADVREEAPHELTFTVRALDGEEDSAALGGNRAVIGGDGRVKVTGVVEALSLGALDDKLPIGADEAGRHRLD